MATDWLNAETLAPWRLAFDTAALVLIWLVQLVIYPVYTYLQRADFARWHPVYTRRVTLVVLPVMLGQVTVYGLLLMTAPAVDVVVNALFVAAIWSVTFLGAVPLHTLLDDPELSDHLPASRRINRVNAWRTGLWTLVWLVTVVVTILGAGAGSGVG